MKTITINVRLVYGVVADNGNLTIKDISELINEHIVYYCANIGTLDFDTKLQSAEVLSAEREEDDDQKAD